MHAAKVNKKYELWAFTLLLFLKKKNELRIILYLCTKIIDD